MKTLKQLLVTTIALTTLLMVGCKKENTATTSYSSITEFFNTKKVSSQIFTVNAATGGIITGAKGTKITFPPNAFVNGSGQTVSGTVNIELKEVFSKGDMIFEKVFPITYGGSILNSAGEYFISASQNGNKVNVKKGHFINVLLPAQAVAPNMQFFLGMPDTMQNIVWVEPDTAQVVVDSQWVNSPVNSFSFSTVPDSSYVITVDSLGWCNADAYMTSVNQSVTCNFTFNESFTVNSSNTKAYALFDGTNSVWPLGVPYWGDITNSIISDTHLADIPMHVLVITVNDGVLYSGVIAVTPTNGGSYAIDISPTTKESLDALILSLH